MRKLVNAFFTPFMLALAVTLAVGTSLSLAQDPSNRDPSGFRAAVLRVLDGLRLDDIGALTPTDSNVIVGDGSTWVAESGSTARTSLGLGTGDSPTFANVTLGAGGYLAGTDADSGVFPNGANTEIRVNGVTRLTVGTGGIVQNIDYNGNGQPFSAIKTQTRTAATSTSINASNQLWCTWINAGASGEVILSAPTAVAGYTARLVVDAAQLFQFKAATGDVIRGDLLTGGAGTITTSATAGFIRSNEVGAYLEVEAIDATTWQITSIGGTWTIDS